MAIRKACSSKLKDLSPSSFEFETSINRLSLGFIVLLSATGFIAHGHSGSVNRFD